MAQLHTGQIVFAQVHINMSCQTLLCKYCLRHTG